MTRQFLCLSLALLAWGCGGSPSAPTPARPPAPQPGPSSTTQLAGIVFDSAERPLSGARVEVLDGPQAGQWTYTARIAPAVLALRPPETTFKLTVDGASFLSGYGTLDVFVAGSAVTAEVGDLHGAPGLVEQVAETTI